MFIFSGNLTFSKNWICNQSCNRSAPLHLYSSCGLIIYPLGLCLNGRPNGWMTHGSVCERESVCACVCMVIGRSNTWAQCVCTIHIAISLYLFLRTERVYKQVFPHRCSAEPKYPFMSFTASFECSNTSDFIENGEYMDFLIFERFLKYAL